VASVASLGPSRPIIAAEIWIFAIAAMALNLLFGYTGMLSFGQATYFGVMFGIVPLEVISWVTSGDIVFMVLIGGIGNLYGPLLGAAIFKWLSEALAVVWARWPLLLGVAFVLVVLFLRGGCVEAWEHLVRLLWRLERCRKAAYGTAADRKLD
jgi:ABC-type branched-subunit amino acid transport system permease subunit